MILVTGGSGLLGANLALVAKQRSVEVCATYCTHPISVNGLETVHLDLTDSTAVAHLIERIRPAGVIHCAAATSIDACEEDPPWALRVNAHAAGELAEAAARVNARLVFVSTDAVFDGERGDYCEEDPPAPINAYALSKRAGELAVASAQPDSVVVRTSLFGWNAQEKLSLAEWVLGRLERGERVPGWTDVVFNPLLATDLAAILLDLLGGDFRGTVHAASSDQLTKFEFARLVARVFGYAEERIFGTKLSAAPSTARRPRNTTLGTSKLVRLLGQPMPGLETSVRRMRTQREQGWVRKLKALLRRRKL